MDYAPKFIRPPLRLYYGWIVAWRQQNGRWFFFRDLPMWYVIEIAVMDDDLTDDDPLLPLTEEASAELMRRSEALVRKAKLVSRSMLSAAAPAEPPAVEAATNNSTKE